VSNTLMFDMISSACGLFQICYNYAIRLITRHLRTTSQGEDMIMQLMLESVF